MDAGLYLVGTPIGNLGDITARAIETLKEANLIIAEDTRQTRKLLTHFNVSTHCISCHKFNEARRCEEITARIQGGEAVAMVTDSGMPCISDPGARIVKACRAAELPITSAPGPTAVATALALSGFSGHGFLFAGFPPRKRGARQNLLDQCAALPIPVIFYESPYRLLKLIDHIEETFGADRPLFVARELTKKFEELLRGTPAEIRAAVGERRIRGECTVVIAPAPKSAPDVPR